MKGLAFPAVPARPSGKLERQYMAFVMGHVQAHAGWWPHRYVREDSLKAMVRSHMFAEDCISIVAVAASDPTAIAGCAIVRPGLIVYCCTNETPGLRRKGIATAMLNRLGVYPTQPHGVTVWTPDCSRVAAAGLWRIFPALPPGAKETT
jgi:hypothetical protein